MCRKHGLTLVEMLFVVLIAAGVLAFAVPAYKRVQERGDYNAALGNLLALNNAVNSLRKDLQVSTGVSVSVPKAGSSVQYGTDEWTGVKPTNYNNGKSWNENVVSQYNDNLTKAFIWALQEFKYLKPLTNTRGYNLYILGKNFSAPAGCKLTNKTPVACMLKSGTKNDCYKGAVILEDGKIERIKGDDCKNN